MMSEGNSALLPANVGQRPLLQRGLMNFQPYNESLKDCSLRKQLILFESQCLSGINIKDQSLNVYYARGG